ncbi:hypothetical protein MHBO_002867, partial [Bonamia ostreae]
DQYELRTNKISRVLCLLLSNDIRLNSEPTVTYKCIAKENNTTSEKKLNGYDDSQWICDDITETVAYDMFMVDVLD